MGVAIPIAVSLVTSFYANTRLLKPRLSVDYAWTEVMVMPVEGRPTEYIAALVDFYPGFQTTLPPGKTSLDSVDSPLSFTGGEIVSAKRLVFTSPKDFVLDASSTSNPLLKVRLANTGYTTATRISVGVRLGGEPSSYTVAASPNVQLAQEVITSTGGDRPFLRIQVDRLGASERAFLTITRGGSPSPKPSPIPAPFLKINPDLPTGPLLYVSCAEATGAISREVSWRDAVKLEQGDFPSSTIGFWASRIHPKNGVVPQVEDPKELELPYELVDNTGRKTGEGTWRLNANR